MASCFCPRPEDGEEVSAGELWQDCEKQTRACVRSETYVTLGEHRNLEFLYLSLQNAGRPSACAWGTHAGHAAQHQRQRTAILQHPPKSRPQQRTSWSLAPAADIGGNGGWHGMRVFVLLTRHERPKGGSATKRGIVALLAL